MSLVSKLTHFLNIYQAPYACATRNTFLHADSDDAGLLLPRELYGALERTIAAVHGDEAFLEAVKVGEASVRAQPGWNFYILKLFFFFFFGFWFLVFGFDLVLFCFNDFSFLIFFPFSFIFYTINTSCFLLQTKYFFVGPN